MNMFGGARCTVGFRQSVLQMKDEKITRIESQGGSLIALPVYIAISNRAVRLNGVFDGEIDAQNAISAA